MTEATADTTTLTEVLVRHGFYQQNGITRIAIEDFTLQDLTGGDTYRVNPNEVTLIAHPGSTEWADRMVRIRTSMVRRLTTAENSLAEKTNYFERLKQAILEVADEKQWCEEYDAFAEEWDLIPRNKNWEVTVTVTVKARNEDDAVEIVKDSLSIYSYSDGVEDGPDFSVGEA